MIEGVHDNDEPELFVQAEKVRSGVELHGKDICLSHILRALREAYRLGMMRGGQLGKEGER